MRFLLFLILVLGSVGTKAIADAPVVHTQNGDVRGVLQGSVESFKALPFAAPPVSDLRWKPPQDPANWLGIRDGSNFSSACPQEDPKSDRVIGSEDCLYLNVFTPQGARGLPVLVFIHGGHNSTESAGLIENGVAAYDGSDFAQNSNVVVVTINYRLGALGFIAHPALSHESGYHASGNYGYMDQIRALKWVSRNIAAFGGDPNNITLFGRSSGGGAIIVLMASPLAQGLFHRAIIHSGQFHAQSLQQAHDTGVFLSRQLNCESQPDNAQKLLCMRNKSAAEIVLAIPGGHVVGSVTGPTLFLPVVDGWILPDLPLNIIGRGEHHHVPILIGNVAEETATIYYDDSKNIRTEQDYINTVKMNYGDAKATQLLNLYPANDYPSPRQAYNAISADTWFVCPAQWLVRAVSASQSEFVGRFLYTHVFSGPKTYPSPGFYGASHGFDVLSLFGSFGVFPLTPTPDDLTLKEKFQKTWADFAKSGNPGSFWDRYNSALDNYAIFNTPMSSGTRLRTKQCDYWYPPGKPPIESPAIGELVGGKWEGLLPP